jgi:hypothetical protein
VCELGDQCVACPSTATAAPLEYDPVRDLFAVITDRLTQRRSLDFYDEIIVQFLVINDSARKISPEWLLKETFREDRKKEDIMNFPLLLYLSCPANKSFKFPQWFCWYIIHA